MNYTLGKIDAQKKDEQMTIPGEMNKEKETETISEEEYKMFYNRFYNGETLVEVIRKTGKRDKARKAYDKYCEDKNLLPSKDILNYFTREHNDYIEMKNKIFKLPFLEERVSKIEKKVKELYELFFPNKLY